MTEQANGASTQYRIGAVSRLTGISPDALRIWERRYAAVSPQRSPGGGRLYMYSPQDVARLRLMKQLVEAGDAIGEIATLNLDALQGRTAEAQRLPFAAGVLTEAAACRVLLVGESLARETQASDDTLTGITPVARYADIADFEARAGDTEADVLVIEQATLHDDSAKRVIDWLNRAKAVHVVVVYRYASDGGAAAAAGLEMFGLARPGRCEHPAVVLRFDDAYAVHPARAGSNRGRCDSTACTDAALRR